eukprot:2497974-Pyramimonas_sp.AAC.1
MSVTGSKGSTKSVSRRQTPSQWKPVRDCANRDAIDSGNAGGTGDAQVGAWYAREGLNMGGCVDEDGFMWTSKTSCEPDGETHG